MLRARSSIRSEPFQNESTNGDEISSRVRQLLVASLYAQKSNLILGALTGTTAAGIAAWVADNHLVYICFFALTFVAVSRVIVACVVSPENSSLSTHALETIYEIGAFSYAFTLGSLAALTLWLPTSADAKILIVANALCYGVAVAARNAGRPVIAIGQLAIVVVPILLACLVVGSVSTITLGVTIILLIPAMASITLNLFNVLRRSIASAEGSTELASRMRTLARTDVVTGLANRMGLNDALSEAMLRYEGNRQFALIWIDLDRFKEVNDLLGHQVGDGVLREVARRLGEMCHQKAVVSRFGGDEFVLFTPIANDEDASRIANEIH